MSLTTNTLKITSTEAAQLWRKLNRAQEPEEVNQLFHSLLANQEKVEEATDAMVALADQIDAEIVAVKAKMEHFAQLHNRALEKLSSWRSALDQTVINLNEQGIISSEVAGKRCKIAIRENPPTCEVLVRPEQLPEKYRITKTKTEIKANKTKIKAAWLKGKPVDGTNVYRKRRVTYSLIPQTSLVGWETEQSHSSNKSQK